MITSVSLLCLAACLAVPPMPAPHLFWTRFPRPAVIVVAEDPRTHEDAILLQTLQGLVARATFEGKSREMIWYPSGHPSYRQWFDSMLRQTGARHEGPVPIADLVGRYREKNIVQGYILYRYDASDRVFHQLGPADESVNVATSLCRTMHAVAVADGHQSAAEALGLKMLFDARGMTESDCYERYRDRFTRKTLAMIEPKVGMCRAEAVALGAFVMSRPGPLYEKALAWLEPDSPILGWGLGDEFLNTEPASRWGHFQTATNWCLNLSALSTETPGRSMPATRLRAVRDRTIWDLTWEDDVHYASFIMSDGDNVQWLMGDFLHAAERSWWNSADRGSAPIGWTYCASDLAQVCPYALDYLRTTGTDRDDFVLGGGGYYYPDRFGKDRPERSLLALHARRIGRYMTMTGTRTVLLNSALWDSSEAIHAYGTLATNMPDLLGIFAIQYAPYTGGGGAVKWVLDSRRRETPVVSARFAIWGQANQSRHGGPSRVAEMVSAMPHDGAVASEDRFSWVVVHAWSWFKKRGPDDAVEAEEVDQASASSRLGPASAGIMRGMAPVRWCAEALAPHVRVLTPTDLLLMMRLRLRPQATLNDALSELLRHAGQSAATRSRIAEARRLLAAGDIRKAFDSGKTAWALLRAVR